MNNIIGIFVGELFFPPELMRKWDENNLKSGGIGGSEIWAIELSNMLESKGYHCMIFADCEKWHFASNGVEYVPYKFITDISKYQEFLCFITSRKTSILSLDIKAKTKILMLHDTLVLDAENREGLHLNSIDYIAYQSDFQKDEFIKRYGEIPNNKFFRTFQAIDQSLYSNFSNVQKSNKMLWSTHKIRGARFLIERVLPLIKKEVPDFEIEVCGYVNDTTDDYFHADGVKILGTLTKSELVQHQKESKIWIYPNWGKYDNGWTIEETFCITAIENAMAGNALFVADKTCFSSTLKGYQGFTGTECFPSDSYILETEEQKSNFASLLAKNAIHALKDEEYRAFLAESAINACKNYTWNNAAQTFINIFDKNMSFCESQDKSIKNATLFTENFSHGNIINEPINLIYHLWIPQKWGNWENRIYQIHLLCLKKYKNLFTNAIFILSTDDISDINRINKIESDIISIGWKGNIKFKIRRNNADLREGKTFYNDLILNLNKYKGLTFFAHSKGMTNNAMGGFDGRNIDSIEQWITSMYYLNLNFFNEVIDNLLNGVSIDICYGALLTRQTSIWNKESWQYNGSFIWINTKKLYDYIKIEGKYIPQCTDRLYAESFLQKMLPFDFNYISSHGLRYINVEQFIWKDFYLYANEFIKALFNDKNELEEYLSFHNNIIKSIE